MTKAQQINLLGFLFDTHQLRQHQHTITL